eukprot:SAG31_NODE_12480_length_938_cov_1.994041_2_plen_46_part_01
MLHASYSVRRLRTAHTVDLARRPKRQNLHRCNGVVLVAVPAVAMAV